MPTTHPTPSNPPFPWVYTRLTDGVTRFYPVPMEDYPKGLLPAIIEPEEPDYPYV